MRSAPLPPLPHRPGEGKYMTTTETNIPDTTMTLQEVIDEVFARHDAECLRLTEQRDEARREVCVLSVTYANFYSVGEEKEAAKDRGWDCFKEEETPIAEQ